MTARTTPIDLAPSGGTRRRLLLKASADPFMGSLLSFDSNGYAHELAAGEPFAGICTMNIKKGGYSADGDSFVECVAGLFEFTSATAISGIDQVDVHDATAIYASDDATLTTTSGGNTLIGKVSGYQHSRARITGTTIDVQ